MDLNKRKLSDAKSKDIRDEDGSSTTGEDEEDFAKNSKFRLTIEPYLFIALFGVIISYLTLQNLLLDKACRVNLNFTEELCDALAARDSNGTNSTEYKEAQEEVQSVVSSINTWKFIIDHTIPILFCLVMGAWSDKHGRKPLLISSQIGYFLGALSLILSVNVDNIGVEVTAVLYGVFHGLGGASVAVNLAMMAYIGDISTEETKTQRLGIAIFAFLSSTPIGSSVAGPIFNSIGYTGTFAVAASCNFVACMYAIFIIKETVDTKKHRDTLFKDLLDASQVVSSIKSLFRRREGWLRAKVISLVSLVFFTTFYFGEMSIMVMYVSLPEFGWDIGKYGIFNTYRFLINLVGMALTLGVVSYYFKVSDPMVGIIGCASQVAASTVLAISIYFGPWMLYLAPVVDLLNGAVIIVNKSMLTKAVPKSEVGQVSAVLCTVEAWVPIVCNPVYNAVYLATLDTQFKGAAFLITAGTMIICIIIFTFLYIDHRRTEKKLSKNPISLVYMKEIIPD